jgi:hypothetical protein
MTDRVDYNRRYYLAHRDEQLAAKKRNYTNDPEFKRLSRERDKRRYEHNAAWGGLLRIDPKLFL